MYIDKIDKIVAKTPEHIYKTKKMKPVVVKSGKCIEYGIEFSKKDIKIDLGDHVRI